MQLTNTNKAVAAFGLAAVLTVVAVASAVGGGRHGDMDRRFVDRSTGVAERRDERRGDRQDRRDDRQDRRDDRRDGRDPGTNPTSTTSTSTTTQPG